MICKPVYEFLLWDNCSNNCKFCFQRENSRLFNHDKRKLILEEVIKFINSDKFIKGSHILICGGEIFDKPKDLNILKSFFSIICQLMKDNIIDLLYINTNLIYKDLNILNEVLYLINYNNLFDRLKFTTSYDIEGRFKNKNDEMLMLNNLLSIKKAYPKCNIVTNIILTKPMCEAIIHNKFSIKNFMNDYQCWVNLIPYIVFDDSLMAKKKDILKTLYIVNKENDGYLKKYITNLDLAQNKLLYMYKNENFIFCSCENNTCGHSINFKKYSSENTCFVCDLKRIFNEYIYY